MNHFNKTVKLILVVRDPVSVASYERGGVF